jgi:hypothetical protein
MKPTKPTRTAHKKPKKAEHGSPKKAKKAEHRKPESMEATMQIREAAIQSMREERMGEHSMAEPGTPKKA